MASVTITIAANANAGSVIRRMACQLEAIAAAMPDNPSTGASTVLTIDNAAGGGAGTVQVTAGPYQTSALPF